MSLSLLHSFLDFNLHQFCVVVVLLMKLELCATCTCGTCIVFRLFVVKKRRKRLVILHWSRSVMLSYNLEFLLQHGLCTLSLHWSMCSALSHLDCCPMQIFGSTGKEELLQGATLYAVYFVILAIGVGSVQFTGVSLSLIGNSSTTNLASIYKQHFHNTCTFTVIYAC